MHAHTHETHGHGQPLSPDDGHLHLSTRRPMRGEKVRLRWAIGVTVLVMVVEVIGGIASNSLALLSDAGHMFTHAFALGISYFAIVVSERPASREKTFGYFRTEVLAAFINGIVLLGITFMIFREAVLRFLHPVPVKGTGMLVVAALGLVANGVSFLLLRGAGRRDLNIKSAFIHVAYDLFSSVAVVACAGVISLTGLMQIDPIVSAAIGLLILVWCIRLLRESVNILLEATPKDVDIRRIHQEVEAIPHVRRIHDIHVWQITTNMYVMTAHVALEDLPLSDAQGVIEQINHVLREHHRIGHTTIQLECADDAGDDAESAPREHA